MISGPPELFVRWHPYNSSLELVWRGIFATYAIMMIWSALHNPGKNLAFIVYISISGGLHSTTMLIMNLISMKNGNYEHLYGDIALWYIISFISSIICYIHWPRRYKVILEKPPQHELQSMIDSN